MTNYHQALFMMNRTLFDKHYHDQLLTGLFQAYFDARKNKRNTINALKFEKHFENNLFELCEERLDRIAKNQKLVSF